MCYVFFAHDTDDRQQLGGKAAALQHLQARGLPVPDWFVLAPQACWDSMTPSQRDALAEGEDADHLERLVPSRAVEAALADALARLAAPSSGPVRVAVRSSALDEDGALHSFAGQLESVLNVPVEHVAAHVGRVWRSAFGSRVRAYRSERGLPPPSPPAVLIQRMVQADSAGVAFSADPATGQRGTAVVSAVIGFGTALVDGEADADTYRVNRDGEVVDLIVAPQAVAHRSGRGAGVEQVEVPLEERERAVLTVPQARAVADLARRAAAAFGRPQDIEWAYEGAALYLLQSRPITTLAALPDPDGTPRLWDNSNIAESYNGVTTPLTFSFARKAYRSVYRTFCRLLGVRTDVLEANADAFDAMIGLVRGRLYYNLASWYRVLALLPGFRFNRAFMEDMMGVRERLTPEDLRALLPPAAETSRRARWRDLADLVRGTLRLVVSYRRLPRSIARFQRRLDQTLDLPDLTLLRLDELAEHYRGLEAALLRRWDAPIVNDFAAMIFFGLSKRLVEQWAPAPGLHNALLSGVGGIVSAEPARQLRRLASTAQDDPALIDALTEGSEANLRSELARRPDVAALVEAYLDRFSDRCLDELKLESPTLRDDPRGFYRSIAALASRLEERPAPPQSDSPVRADAEALLAQALRGHPLRRALARWTLHHARTRIAARENLRFERTRVFGTARRLFVEMGRRLSADAVLDQPDDVFYLDVEEVLGFADGTATTADLRGLVAVRRREFDGYRAATAPPDRFTTRGAVHAYPIASPADAAMLSASETDLQGLGCGPGTVRGLVRVVHDPHEAVLQGTEILVAERTDPGWISLFASCGGLVVERGSLLSHAAIVARELGLPAVVGLPDATRRLADGDLVEIDGRTGTVRVIEPASASSFAPTDEVNDAVCV
ncbi:MAG: PEP/pyruvate-binding domain-containing protein [Bacteroidota bacterium]